MSSLNLLMQIDNIEQPSTCMDYTDIGSPIVKLNHRHYFLHRMNQRGVGEEEEGELLHALNKNANIVTVYNYNGTEMFRYPSRKLVNHFAPRSIYIKNNIIYITDFNRNQLLLFTTNGELITTYDLIHSFNPMNCLATGPKGVVADETNNIYVCVNNSLLVLNSMLPQYQIISVSDEPRDIKIFDGQLYILSWQFEVSVLVLSLTREFIRRIPLTGFHFGTIPWYFEIDPYGNLIFPDKNSNGIIVYSNEGKLITSKHLQFVEKPNGIKLFDNKRKLCITCNGHYYFLIF